MVINKENESKKVYGMIVGALYLLFGSIQVIVGLGINSRLTEILFIPPDFMGGIILILIGLIFLFGVKELNDGINEGVAYVYVGILIAIVFIVIYLLIIVANGINAYVLSNEDFRNWTPLDDMRPGIYLGILPIIGLLIWHKKFSLTGAKNGIR